MASVYQNGASTENLKEQTVESLRDQLNAIYDDRTYRSYAHLDKLPHEYRDVFTGCTITMSVIAIALIVGFVAVTMLFLSRNLTTLPQDFMNWAQHVNPWNLTIGGGIAAVLFGGGVIVIHRARCEKDPQLQSDIGDLCGMDEQLDVAEVTYRKTAKHTTSAIDVYVDRSTLKERSGKAYLYRTKTVWGHYEVSCEVIGSAPFYMITKMAYHLLRTVVVPFYILIQMIIQRCDSEKPASDLQFNLTDVPKEMGKSLLHVVKAPFYALAFLMAGFYALVNPIGGRKLVSAIERDWNDGVTLAGSFWSVQGRQELYRWEGGGEPSKLGGHAYYLAGCWQPVGVVTFVNGEVSDVLPLEKAVSDASNRSFKLLLLRSEMESLNTEANDAQGEAQIAKARTLRTLIAQKEKAMAQKVN